MTFCTENIGILLLHIYTAYNIILDNDFNGLAGYYYYK